MRCGKPGALLCPHAPAAEILCTHVAGVLPASSKGARVLAAFMNVQSGTSVRVSYIVSRERAPRVVTVSNVGEFRLLRGVQSGTQSAPGWNARRTHLQSLPTP